MTTTIAVKVDRAVVTRAQVFCSLHDRTLDELIEESLDYWLKTCGEAYTEELTEKTGGEVN